MFNGASIERPRFMGISPKVEVHREFAKTRYSEEDIAGARQHGASFKKLFLSLIVTLGVAGALLATLTAITSAVTVGTITVGAGVLLTLAALGWRSKARKREYLD